MSKVALILVLILSVFAFSAEASTVGLWTFDETSGNTAYDSSGYGSNGTIYGGATRTNDTPFSYFGNSAMSFDGVSNYINCGNNPILQPLNTFTLEAWVKPASVGYKYIADSAERFLLKLSDFTQSPLASIRKSVDAIPSNDRYYNLVSDVTIPLNEWSHVASTYDGTYLRLYVDGQLHGQTLLNTPLSPAGTDPIDSFFIGDVALNNYFTHYYFDGLMDEVRVSDVALAPEQLGYSQSFGAPVPEPTTMVLFSIGLLGARAIRRRKKS